VRSQTIHSGRAWIQDEGSQLVALLVGNGSSILDCCAAPGGKTAILAEQNPTAKIRAMDLHKHRADNMRMRLGSTANVEVVQQDVTVISDEAVFERVLADVPCSGTGTLARNPEIRWRLRPDDLQDLHKKQVAILKAAVRQVGCGGRVVYSSCSLEPEENAAVVEEVLRSEPGLQVLPVYEELERLRSSGELVWADLDSLVKGPHLRILPGVQPCDGFFAAILEKTAK